MAHESDKPSRMQQRALRFFYNVAMFIFAGFTSAIVYLQVAQSGAFGKLPPTLFGLPVSALAFGVGIGVSWCVVHLIVESSVPADARREQLIDSLTAGSVTIELGKDSSDQPEYTDSKIARPDEPEASSEGFFDKLVQITLFYVESYYKQTQKQANKSFLLSAFAAVISLGVMVYGAWGLFHSDIKESAIVCASGAFGQFISAVFFYLFNQTALKMSEYHQKLVLTQNIALALKITEGLPRTERTKAQITLVATLTKDINHYLCPNPVPAPVSRKAKRKKSSATSAPEE